VKRSRGWSLAVSYPVEICSITEHFDDMLCQAISNFAVSWYRLRYLGVRVLVPIVSAPMTNQDTPHVFDFPHKLRLSSSDHEFSVPASVGNLPGAEVLIDIFEVFLQFIQSCPLAPVIRILFQPANPNVIFLVVNELYSFHKSAFAIVPYRPPLKESRWGVGNEKFTSSLGRAFPPWAPGLPWIQWLLPLGEPWLSQEAEASVVEPGLPVGSPWPPVPERLAE